MAEDPSAADSDAPEEPPTLEDRIASLEAERDRLKSEVQSLQDKFLRARADYENYAKRATREQQEAVQSAKAAALIRVAEATESLEKAVAHAQEAGADAKGLQMVVNEYWRILKDEGLRPIQTDGVPFNYRHHMAVERTETEDEDDGTILEVYQRGYLLDDKVLRPAMVRVAVAPSARQTPDEEAAPTAPDAGE